MALKSKISRRLPGAFSPSTFRVIILSLIILSSVQVRCIVARTQFPTNPFDLRTSFPSAPRSSVLLNSGNQKAQVSASNINPVGFDFTKLRSVTVRSNRVEDIVKPLAWVDLPLFDTPVFRHRRPDPVFIPPKRTANKEPQNNFPKMLVKSDWDGFGKGGKDMVTSTTTTPPPISKVEKNESESITPSATVNGSTNKSSVFVVKQIDTNHNNQAHLRRKIQLSNRRGQFQGSDGSKIKSFPKPVVTTRRINHQVRQSDHVTSESRRQEATAPSLSTSGSIAVPSIIKMIDQAEVKLPVTSMKPSPISPNHLEPSSGSTSYKYRYSVSNAATKDIKSHSETRSGETVLGEYSFLEPDGYTRIVKYSADSSGFKASVRRVRL